MLTNLLTSVICAIYRTYKRFVTIPDYTIIKEELEYIIDHRRKFLIDDLFWEHESRGWDTSLHEYHTDVSEHSFRNTCIPQNITKILLRTKYWYNNKNYKFITYNISEKVPKVDNISFSIPFSKAVLLDADDKPARDVTEKIRRYAGPKNDFHGSDVLIKDMLYFTNETLKNEYPKIKVTNIMGLSKTIDTLTGSISDLRLS
jgi:hypothetical protein